MGVTAIAVTHARPVDRNQNIPERAGLHAQLRRSPSRKLSREWSRSPVR